jgi:hypothetical protein
MELLSSLNSHILCAFFLSDQPTDRPTDQMEQNPLEAHWSSADKILHVLWNLEGLLPHSQEPATCPYPEPDQIGPHPQPIS